MNLLFGSCKIKYGIETTVVKLRPNPTPLKGIAEESTPQDNPDRGGQLVAAQTPTLQARVRLSQILNQALDQEIPMLPEAKLLELRGGYIQVIGDEPLQTVDATDAQ